MKIDIMRWLRDPSRLGEWTFLLILGLLALIVVFFGPASVHGDDSGLLKTSSTAPQEAYRAEEVELAIRYMLRDVPPRDKRLQDAGELSQVIVEESDAAKVDPFLVTSMMFYESSFKPEAQGSVQEWGLLQVHPGANRCKDLFDSRGLDKGSMSGQVACGVLHLVDGLATCGYLVKDEELCVKHRKKCSGALSRYLSGDCRKAGKSESVSFGVARRLSLKTRLKRLVHVDRISRSFIPTI